LTTPLAVRVESPKVEPATEPREATSPAWGAAKRLLFRFAFVYLVLYNLPFPLSMLSWHRELSRAYPGLWRLPVHWVGQHLFHVDITVLPNGSGDTTFNYVLVFCYLALATGAALAWTLLDRRRPNYQRLYAWLRVYVRFALAATMISYGIVKVIELQFSSVTPDRLVQTYGESSPMGLLWTFMGFSALYCFFGGATEVLGGLLLTLRRTTLLGALVCAGVLANVVMLNLSFDVPVKLFSSHLLAQALFLAAPDLRRLIDFFLLNRTAEPAPEPPLIARARVRKIAEALVMVLFVAYVGYALLAAHKMSKTDGELAPKPPFYGIWTVDEMAIDGQVRPPLLTDPDRWRRVIFPYPDQLALQSLEGSTTYYDLKLTPVTHTLILGTFPRSKQKSYPLSYRETGAGRLEIEGAFKGRKIHATLHREEQSKYLLISRGFHWINEHPLNQ
jgi:hypothetical protein